MKMKKNRFANLLKIGILFFGISLLLLNCEKYDYITIENTNKENFIITDNNFQKLTFDRHFNDAIEFLKPKGKIKSKNTSNKEDNDIYNFDIDSTKIRKIETDSIVSYTFFIRRENPTTNYFENLLVNIKQNEDPEAFIIKYKPDNIKLVAEHNSFDIEGNIEITQLDYNKLNTAAKTSCLSLNVVYCTLLGYDNSTGEEHESVHIATPDCYTYDASNRYSVTFTSCSGSTESNESSSLGGSLNDGNTSSGGGVPGAGKPTTTPLIPCTVGENDISTDGLCFSDEILDLGILADLTNSQYNWITTNLTAKSYLENLLDIKLNLGDLKLFTAKVIDILKGDKNPNILTTKLENELFVGLVGEILHKKNNNLFFEYDTIFNDLDTANILSVTDWQMMSQKINQIHGISRIYSINDLTQLSELTLFDQKTIAENALFISILPSVSSIIGQYWPKNEEEWTVIGDLFVQFLPELALGLIPGSSIVDVIKGANENDAIAVTVGITFIIADFAGGTIFKAIKTAGKVTYKVFTSFKIVHKFLKTISKVLKTGLKTKLVDDVVHLTDNLDNTVAKIKDDVVEIITKKGLKLVDPSDIKNLSKIDPTSSGFINSTKLADAKKFKPSESSLKADFDNLKNLDNNQLGLQSETLADKLFKQDNYKAPDEFKIPGFNGNNGFDGVYIKKDAVGNVTDIIINEVKQVNNGAIALSSANTATGLPRQMTNDWIDNVIERMLQPNTSQSVKNLANLIKANDDKITKVVTGIDKTKGEILIFPIN
jgi:hypothetical protein